MRMAEFQVRKMLSSESVVTPGPEVEEFQPLSSSSKRSPDEENIEASKRRRISSENPECGDLLSTEFRDVGVDEPQQIRKPLKSQAWVNKYQVLEQVREGEEVEEGEISEGEVKDVVVEGAARKGCCCSHEKELEGVKLELAKVRKESKARGEEIKSLQKLVAALSRREGLA